MNLSLNIRHLPLRSCTLLHPNGSFYRTLTARPIPDDSKSLRAAALKPKLLILCSVLGLNSGAAKSCIQKFPEIEHLSVRQILKSGVIMKNYNIDTRRRGWVQLLTLCPISLMAICDFLKSVGIMLIKPKHILNSSQLMSLPIGLFKAHTGIERHVNVTDQWINALPPNLHEKTRAMLAEAVGAHDPVLKSRNIIFANYLAWRLKCEIEEASELIKHGVGRSPVSFSSFSKTLDILFETGFDLKKIRLHPEVIGAEPGNLQDYLKVARLLNFETPQLLLTLPSICRIDFDLFEENVTNLNRFGFPDYVIVKNPSLLAELPSQLLKKLGQINDYPELSVFAYDPKFARLLNKIDTISIRLEALRATDKRHVSIHLVSSAKDAKFVDVLMHGQFERMPSDVVHYLTHHTGLIKEEIYGVLKAHPYRKESLTIENLKEVIELLVKWKFSRVQMANGLTLVLYPAALIAQQLALLPTRPGAFNMTFNDFRSHAHVLQVVLYHLEEEYHFTGKGVFADTQLAITENPH